MAIEKIGGASVKSNAVGITFGVSFRGTRGRACARSAQEGREP
jgi:hypothetical protein